MKKLLLFLLTFVATTVAATADEVSFDFKNNEYGLTVKRRTATFRYSSTMALYVRTALSQ